VARRLQGIWIAARKWMENHRLIVITKPAKVLPHFPKKKGHN
jgi:hypothetical protein